MTRTARLVVGIVLATLMFLTVSIAGATVAVLRGGTVHVEVSDPGGQFRVGVPAGLVRAALAIAPDALLAEAATELRPVLPALVAGWQELERTPDFVLVDARSRGEHVRVEKQGRRMLVSVDGPDGRVRIALPLSTLGAVLEKLERGV